MLDLIAEASLKSLQEFGFGIAATVAIVVVGIIIAAMVADDDSAVIEECLLGNGARDTDAELMAAGTQEMATTQESI